VNKTQKEESHRAAAQEKQERLAESKTRKRELQNILISLRRGMQCPQEACSLIGGKSSVCTPTSTISLFLILGIPSPAEDESLSSLPAERVSF